MKVMKVIVMFLYLRTGETARIRSGAMRRWLLRAFCSILALADPRSRYDLPEAAVTTTLTCDRHNFFYYLAKEELERTYRSTRASDVSKTSNKISFLSLSLPSVDRAGPLVPPMSRVQVADLKSASLSHVLRKVGIREGAYLQRFDQINNSDPVRNS